MSWLRIPVLRPAHISRQLLSFRFSPFTARSGGGVSRVDLLLRSLALDLLELNASSPTRRRIIVAGDLSAGPVLEFRVPDRGRHGQYRVRLLQVAGEGYALRDRAAYSAVVSR